MAKLSFEDAQILMVEQNQLVARTAHGAKRIGKNKAVHPLILNLGEGITGLVARSGRSEIVDDTRLDSRYYCGHFAGLSEVAVPIWIDDQVKGVINCESQYPGFFNELHLEILTEVADLVSSKIKMLESSKRLYKMQMLNRAVLDSTPHSFMLLDPDNVVQSFNGTAMRVFREVLNTELHVGDDFWQFCTGRIRP
ncbi:MAG: GAF domain-containing protein [Owenweeksia sp.]|nr:GAF domain-containing protein [Owenweeksia sp.]